MLDVDSTLPDSASLSLLSLSIAAANAAPIPLAVNTDLQSSDSKSPPSVGPTATVNGHGGSSSSTTHQGSTTIGTGAKQHRRLSSTGKARRRLSDARDAAVRPSPATLPTTGLVPLSLSTSLPTHTLSTVSPFPPKSPQASIPVPVARKPLSSDEGTPTSPSLDEGSAFTPPSHGKMNNRYSNPTTDVASLNGVAINGAKIGKKKGMDHRCETCSKIYRHPSCLIKHRWEHTPHWREASKFVLSKHQQVQLLEAAAILSHLSPSSATGTSLPEDRSLWPSFLSGGTLAPPSTSDVSVPGSVQSFPSSSYDGHPISSSVPATNAMSPTTRPRLHDYAIPTPVHGPGGITQLRPGLLGVPTGSGVAVVSKSPPSSAMAMDTTPPSHGSLPVPVPTAPGGSKYRGLGGIFGDDRLESWGSHPSPHYGQSSYTSTGAIPGSFGGSVGGWSLPRSSLRSVSGSSRSRSRSRSVSRSDEESDPIDGDLELVGIDDRLSGQRYGFGMRGRANEWMREEEDKRLGFSVREEDEYEEMRKDGRDRIVEEDTWDGMDMEMEMD